MNETNENNSRPFDVHRWSDHPEVKQFVYRLWDEEIAKVFLRKVEEKKKKTKRTQNKAKGKQHKTKPKYQFKVLVLDLYVAWTEDPARELGVHMSPRKYKAGSRYNAIHISQIMPLLIRSMEDLGYIDVDLGSNLKKRHPKKKFSKKGRITLIRSTEKLATLFEKTKFSEYDIGLTDDEEVIILNDKEPDPATGELPERAKAIEYNDSDYGPIPQMREDVRAYNTLLRKTFVDIGMLESPCVKNVYWDKDEKCERIRKVPIRQNNKRVRRVFYRGCWDFGGRIHGGWWQQINSGYRKHILINDRRTIEVDYSGLHVNLIHAIENEPLPDDPYRLERQFFGFDPNRQRKLVKGLVLVAINADERKKAFQAFRAEQVAGSEEKRIRDGALGQVLDEFIRCDPVVEKYICTGKGLELMHLDGWITSYIINFFTRRDSPVLSVHDSYIVPEGHDGQLHDVMKKAIAHVMGAKKFPVTQDVVSLHQLQTFANMDLMDRGVFQQQMMQPPEIKRTDSYCRRRDEFYAWLESKGIPLPTMSPP